VLWGHGVGGGVGVLEAHGRALDAAGRFAEVATCCLHGRPRLAEVVAGLGAPRLYLVPMLMADGYTARERLAEEIAGLGAEAERLTVAPVLGAHAGLAEVLTAKALAAAVARGWQAAETRLLLVGHGTARQPRSRESAIAQAERIARHGCFAAVDVAFLEAEPRLDDCLAGLPPGPLVVSGLFADRGMHGEKDVPAALASHRVDAAYTGPIGSAPEIRDLVLDQVGQLVAVAEPVS
jgi:sirohydrochlorin cobaltochelatase